MPLMNEQILGVVLSAGLWAFLGAVGVLVYKLIRELEEGAKSGKYSQGL